MGMTIARSIDRTRGHRILLSIRAPPKSLSAREPGSGVVASIVEDSQLEPGPNDGPFLQNASRRSSPAQRD